jgi:2-oxopent-4-enoate/cis-2-oxohex-4-enoate hydratase
VTLSPAQIRGHGDHLYDALRARQTVPPLTARGALSTIDAYEISRRILSRREQDGERVIGKKIGVTSKAVQTMLEVYTPDFGWLTDAMRFDEGAPVPIGATLIQPRAEAELAFVLARPLRGPGVTAGDVLAATAHVIPCFEIVDSRIEGWRIRYQDTVADNASSGLFLLGAARVDPRGIDFAACAVSVSKNGAPLSRGTGAEAMGSPLACVAWLANQLGQLGHALEAGEIVLSGSLVPLEPVVPGDVMRMDMPGIGSTEVRFS